MNKDELESFVWHEDTVVECLQVAPMGGGKVAILFLLSDSDYETTVSVVFIVEDFDPKKARGILVTTEWLMALSAAPSQELFAFEATTWIWRYDGAAWSREKISDSSLRQVWAEDPGGALAVGADGVGYRLVGGAWVPITPIVTTQYFDIHGHPKHGIYACGEMGVVHRLTEAGWVPLELHRHDQFRGIDIADDGTIRVAGDNGICLRIANEEVVDLEARADITFLAVRTYAGNAYWGDELGVNIEEGNAVVPFHDTKIASDLRQDGDYLYAAGTNKAWRFNGKGWQTLTLSYDNGFQLT